MSSDHGPPSNATRCPDFHAIQTGVGVLTVPPGLAGQMHMLHHNGLGRGGFQPCRTLRVNITEPSTAILGARATPRHRSPSKKPSPSPRPPPSRSFDDLMQQWERLLTWATLKTLKDFDVMPAAAARATSRRLATRILDDYGPSLHKWLGRRGPNTTKCGTNTT